jgi:hypothetical protein
MLCFLATTVPQLLIRPSGYDLVAPVILPAGRFVGSLGQTAACAAPPL